MPPPTPGEPYRAVLVPALQSIQEQFGFLDRDALRRYSESAGVPLYRLQAVASFFPHFKLAPPKAVTLRVCQDMACQMAGSREMLAGLRSLEDQDVEVEGVSCLGRCDRAPAACVARTGQVEDLFYHRRSAEELARIVRAALGKPLPPDRDAEHVVGRGKSAIDPEEGGVSEYPAVRRVIAARAASIEAVVSLLLDMPGWSQEEVRLFRECALRSGRSDAALPPKVAEVLRRWQRNDEWAEAVFRELDEADLRGLGGAGVPASQKWRDVRDAGRELRRREAEDDRAFVIVNGDESEPGTFKDREILLRHARTVIEGMIIAGLVTEATQGFIFIRREYPEQIAACRAEIARAAELGLCGPETGELGRAFPISVFVSPGGYICGEQSALVEAMSDRRAEPRNMPPKLETNGLQDRPTLVSNVETFAWVPTICLKGGRDYAAQGVNGWKGRRLFSVSGDVRRAGVYEVPMGMTLRELIEGADFCQGMVGSRKLKAFAPSGPSGGFLPATLTAANGLPREHTKNKVWQALAARRGFDPMANRLDILDLELELNVFRALTPAAALGAGLVVYDEKRDMVPEAARSLEFFRRESCGKCVPCRIGSQKLAALGNHLAEGGIAAGRWESEIVPMVKELGNVIGLTSICGLGRAVPLPLLTVMQFFPDDVARHLTVKGEGKL